MPKRSIVFGAKNLSGVQLVASCVVRVALNITVCAQCYCMSSKCGVSFNHVGLLDDTHPSRVGKTKVKTCNKCVSKSEGDILTEHTSAVHRVGTLSGLFFFLWTGHVRVPMSVGVRQNGRAQKLGSCNNAAFPPSTLWCCNGTALSRNERGRMPSLHLPEPCVLPMTR